MMFCFAFLHSKPLLKKGSTLKGKNLLPLGANSFLLEWTPFQKGGKTILTELSSLKVYPVPLKELFDQGLQCLPLNQHI